MADSVRDQRLSELREMFGLAVAGERDGGEGG